MAPQSACDLLAVGAISKYTCRQGGRHEALAVFQLTVIHTYLILDVYCVFIKDAAFSFIDPL